MAEITIAVQNLLRSGLEPTTNSSLNAANTYKVRNNGNVLLWLVNGDASPHTFTVETPKTQGGYDISDQDIAVGASKTIVAGPWPPHLFNDENGDLNITLDDATNMELAAISL